MRFLLSKHLNSLIDWFNKYKSQKVGVCFSGGVDSGVLLYAANLSKTSCYAITAKSPIRTEKSFQNAKSFTESLDIPFIEIKTDEWERPEFLKNGSDRCYICKVVLFSTIRKANSLNTALLVDGTNIDDLKDFRPGLKAVKEFNVKSPYKELQMGKKEILKISEDCSLPLPSRATTCLSTRFLPGTEINPDLFPVIEKIENSVLSLGFSDVRARVTKDGFRLEVPGEEVPGLYEKVDLIEYPSGYKIEVDPEGYRPAGINYKEYEK